MCWILLPADSPGSPRPDLVPAAEGTSGCESWDVARQSEGCVWVTLGPGALSACAHGQGCHQT